jgi:superfamily II DNA helicase RecQ
VQGLSIRSTDVFRTLSHAWHAFLGFPPHKGRETVLGKRAFDDAAPAQEQEQQQQQLPKRVKTAQQVLAAPTSAYGSNSSTWSRDAAAIEEAVRKVLGILPGCPVTYKSPDQKRALEAVVQGVSPLIVVLPTGGGKTLLPMAAAVLDSSQQADQPRVTILVLPFRALIEDMLVRLQGAGITAAEWQPGAHNELENRRMLASVVLVSADHVGSSSGQFLSYAALLAQQQILRRVVVDECHTAITADSWRPKLTKLRDVRLLPCQLVLLTATLPPSREEELRKALLVPTATIVRAETTQRAGTQYAVVQCQGQQKLAETAVQLAHRLMEEARAARVAAPACTGAAASAVGKGIVYCRSRQLCERLAALLDCPAYHAGVASRTELLQA